MIGRLKLRCAELGKELEHFSDSRRLLEELLEGPPAEQTGASSSGAVERAAIEDLLGQCNRALGQHEEAEQWFRRAIEHEPSRIDTYDRLARLLRSELRQDDAATGTIAKMVAKNPESGRAHALRWRYFMEFSPPPDNKDIDKALELAPDDRDVLLVAVLASEQKRDMAAMRAHLEKGLRLNPTDSRFAMCLAWVEAREGHPERGEPVLQARVRGPAVCLSGLCAGRDSDPPGQNRGEGRSG